MTVSLEATFREEWPRAVAILTRVLGDLSLAEDAVQDAFATALERYLVLDRLLARLAARRPLIVLCDDVQWGLDTLLFVHDGGGSIETWDFCAEQNYNYSYLSFSGDVRGEQLMREAIGIRDEWVLAGHVVVGWPRGRHGPVRRRPVSDVVFRNRWDPERADIIYGPGARPEPKT